MYRTLFDVAGLAMLGWLLLVLLPRWRATRFIAESAVFPVYLSLLYLVGIVAVFRELGLGIVGDFGSAAGVLGLLGQEPVALVAWIHILAFDQAVGVLIYRDNMRYGFVPLPVQSVILLATLMLGPLGFLSYWALRTARSRSPVAWGEHEPQRVPVAPTAPAGAPHFRSMVVGRSVPRAVLDLLRRTPTLTSLGLLGFVLAAITSAVAVANGGWLLAPEGRLLEAVKFDVAIGTYVLTLALLVPLAPMTERGRRRWVAWTVGLGLFGYAVENVQAWRGLDPRFSEVAGPLDQAIGGVFFLSALGLLVLFAILMRGFFRDSALPDHGALRLALRYGAAGAFTAFAVGVAMSLLQGRVVAGGGDLMPIHAAGFHALQAVPLVALLLGASPVSRARAERWVHVAGIGWLALCLGLVVQALTGHPPLHPTPALAVSAGGVLVWSAVTAAALRGRRAAVPALG